MLISSGPYTTSDSLDMTPLHDLLAIVSQESPNVLLLVGKPCRINDILL